MASKKLKDMFAKWHRDYVEKNFRVDYLSNLTKFWSKIFSKFSHSDFNVFKWNPNYSSLWLIKNVPIKIFVRVYLSAKISRKFQISSF